MTVSALKRLEESYIQQMEWFGPDHPSTAYRLERVNKARAMVERGPVCPSCGTEDEWELEETRCRELDTEARKWSAPGEPYDDAILCRECGEEHPDPFLFMTLFTEGYADES